MTFRRMLLTATAAGTLMLSALTAAAPARAAERQIWGCPRGEVCVYTLDGWTKQTPEATYGAYGYNLLHDQFGRHVVFNNQYGYAGAYLCTGSGGGCGPEVAVNGAVVYDLTPINSIRLTETGGKGGEQVVKQPTSDVDKWWTVSLDDRGDKFVNFDFNWGGSDRPDMTKVDWPVNLVFVSRGKISTSIVKNVVAAEFKELGGAMHAFLQESKWDDDHGRKIYPGKCGKEGPEADANFHFRVYGPDGEGAMSHPAYGNFVVATAHIDFRENCSSGPAWFGMSEIAETYVAGAFEKMGKRVEWNKIPLKNAEDLGNRFNNGYATVVHLDN